MIQVAFRIGKPKDIIDLVIVFFSASCCTHCELVFSNGESFSSDPKSGGTRFKDIDYSNASEWELIPLPWITETEEHEIRAAATYELGCRYDWLAILLGWLIVPWNKLNQWFCTEIGMHLLSPYLKRPTTAWLTPSAYRSIIRREYDLWKKAQK